MWQEIGITVFGLLLTAIGTMIAWNLQSIKSSLKDVSDRQATQDQKIGDLEKSYLLCKQDCQRAFTTKEDWLREAGNSRVKLEEISGSLNQLVGKLTIMEKLPEICGSIAQSIAREMKGT